MIDLIGQFEKYEKAIFEYVSSRKETYFKSDCYKRLRNRYSQLNDMIDLRAHAGRGDNKNNWKSKIVFPLVRQQFLIRKAFTKANFRNDPLISVSPAGNTPIENAINVQDVLNLNLKNTKFRARAFNRIIDTTSRCGAGVAVTKFSSDVKSVKKTAKTPFGYERVERQVSKKNALNNYCHPLNYFQNAEVSEPDESDFRGWIERTRLDQLVAEVKKDQSLYIKRNLEDVIRKAQTGLVEDKNYYHIVQNQDWNAVGVDIDHGYYTLNIRGNEDDDTIYYLQWAGDKIIRIQENPFDEDIVPISIFRYDIRPEYWWGNVDIENQIPAENFLNLVLGMKADNAIRNLEQYIFYDKEKIHPADIMNRRKAGGWIGVDLPSGTSLSSLIYGYQGRDISGQDVDYIVREMKEVSQRMAPQPDLQRPAAQGGLQNKTLGAAQMIQEQGNILEADMLEQFSQGLISMGEANVVMLQQFLGDRFAVRPDIKQAQRILSKGDILGQYSYEVESSLSKNKIGEAMRLSNVITAIQNFKGTGDPAFANIDVTKIVREWLRKIDIPGDVDDIYPEQNALAAPGAVPSLNMPGQELPGGAVQDMDNIQPEMAGVGMVA